MKNVKPTDAVINGFRHTGDRIDWPHHRYWFVNPKNQTVESFAYLPIARLVAGRPAVETGTTVTIHKFGSDKTWTVGGMV
ncbi:MAG: hypothetical protein HUU10_04320 [Bacteroidetes bacterium]|nr:hypothetical protein [Bacteroidota bacterium]